jgi:hypothetical protein
MTKRYADSEIILEGTFRNSSGTLTNPTAVTFTYRIGRDGRDIAVTPTNPSAGLYRATFTPENAGMLYGVFEGSGTLVKTVPVQCPVFPNQLPVG